MQFFSLDFEHILCFFSDLPVQLTDFSHENDNFMITKALKVDLSDSWSRDGGPSISLSICKQISTLKVKYEYSKIKQKAKRIIF